MKCKIYKYNKAVCKNYLNIFKYWKWIHRNRNY